MLVLIPPWWTQLTPTGCLLIHISWHNASVNPHTANFVAFRVRVGHPWQ
jgi:hypothetical protein